MNHTQFFEGTSDVGYFGFAKEHFEYDRLVDMYNKLFGPENVLVVTQENLVQDMEGTSTKVAQFTQNSVYSCLQPAAFRVQSPSYPEYLAPVLRRINHIQSSTLNPNPIVALGHTPGGLYRFIGYVFRRPPFSTLLQGRRPVSRFVRQRFAGQFADSNRRLKVLVDEPLLLTGYDGLN